MNESVNEWVDERRECMNECECEGMDETMDGSGGISTENGKIDKKMEEKEQLTGRDMLSIPASGLGDN